MEIDGDPTRSIEILKQVTIATYEWLQFPPVSGKMSCLKSRQWVAIKEIKDVRSSSVQC